LVVPAVAGLALFLLPLLGLVAQADWGHLPGDLATAEVGEALGLSIICSLSATGVALLLGVPLAWFLARAELPGRAVLRALVTVPAVLPPVVGGVALLLAFGRRAPLGRLLESALGVTLPFSTLGAILAETFVAMPFLVLAAEAGLRTLDIRLEEAATTLGAGRWTVFRRVTLPLLAPSIGAGAALCWARALGEFGATITFAGSVEGRTQTLPLEVYNALETRPESAIATSLLLLLVSLLVLVLLRGRIFPAGSPRS